MYIAGFEFEGKICIEWGEKIVPDLLVEPSGHAALAHLYSQCSCVFRAAERRNYIVPVC